MIQLQLPIDSRDTSLPHVYLDRSIGRTKVADGLRAAGLEVITSVDVYNERDEHVPDEDWLEVVGVRGWVALTKDKSIRRHPSELNALLQYGARCLCFSNAQLTADQALERFLRALPEISAACQDPGPFLYMIHQDQIRAVELGTDRLNELGGSFGWLESANTNLVVDVVKEDMHLRRAS